MNKKNIIIAIAVVILAGGAFWFLNSGGSISEIGKGIGGLSNRYNDLPIVTGGDINLEISADGFKPNKFVVSAGQQLTFVVTNKQVDSHAVIKFEDPLIASQFSVVPIIPIGLNSKQTVTFIVPKTPDKEYVFYTDVGEKRTGVFIVK